MKAVVAALNHVHTAYNSRGFVGSSNKNHPPQLAREHETINKVEPENDQVATVWWSGGSEVVVVNLIVAHSDPSLTASL